MVQLKRGPVAFRSTAVKPYYEQDTGEQDEEPVLEDNDSEGINNKGEDQEENTVHDTQDSEEQDEPSIPRKRGPGRPRKNPKQAKTGPKRGRGQPRKLPVFARVTDIDIQLPDKENFETFESFLQYDASRQKEVNGLLEKGVFQIANINDIPPGVRIFSSRFVDTVKFEGTDKALEKSRLVVQAYNDEEKELVLTQSPTIQRASQRLLLCLAQMGDYLLLLRDISQAYVQSATELNREFYVRPPQELKRQLGLDDNAILHVLKPLYGVPEAGNHWFKTYHDHHAEKLGVEQSTFDPCLLFSNTPFGVIGLQTDDTLILADTDMAEREEVELKKAKLLAKDREQLTTDHPLDFNGGAIKLQANGDITLTQEKQLKAVKFVTQKPLKVTNKGKTKSLTSKEQYIRERARGAYIASISQPEAAFDLSFAAQVVNPGEGDAKALNKRLEWQMANQHRGLKFVKLDPASTQLVVFTDASFANNKDLSSQIGYVLVLKDSKNKANIVHWSSTKCKRVTRSVLASELYAMAHGFDIGTAIKSTTELILQKDLPMVLATDSKSLYDCLVRLGTTAEKRLMIDVMGLRQAYERRLISDVQWIDGEANPADAMTKGKACVALTKLIDSNTINLKAIGWVERSAGAEK